jgi:hypothetical protein
VVCALRKQVLTNLITGPPNLAATVRKFDLATAFHSFANYDWDVASPAAAPFGEAFLFIGRWRTFGNRIGT